MENKFFTPEEEEILIDLISEYPPLYSSKDEAFKDKDLKAAIWKKIADSLGKNEEICKTKWKNLRDYYNKKKRVANQLNSSSTPGRTQKYERYLRMKFLEAADPKSTSNGDINISEDENSLTQEPFEQASVKDISIECDENGPGSTEDPDVAIEESSLPPNKKAKVSPQDRSGQQRILMEYLQPSEERMDENGEVQFLYDDLDEATSYGAYATVPGDPLEDFFRGIITTVKTFPPELQIKAKRSISNMVFDLEQEMLSNKIKPKTQTAEKLSHHSISFRNLLSKQPSVPRV